MKTLKEAFTHLQELQGWKDNDTIRLIFHIFKPIKNIEFEVICKLMESFPRFKIQFAFVTISKKHPYKLYEASQFGVMKYSEYETSLALLDNKYCPSLEKNVVIPTTLFFSDPLKLLLRMILFPTPIINSLSTERVEGKTQGVPPSLAYICNPIVFSKASFESRTLLSTINTMQPQKWKIEMQTQD